MEVKQLAPHPESGTHHRGELYPVVHRLLIRLQITIGYSAPGREKIKHNLLDDAIGAMSQVKGVRARFSPESPIVPRDVKESFEVGSEDDPDMPNIWFPADVFPGFREACLDFYWVSGK